MRGLNDLNRGGGGGDGGAGGMAAGPMGGQDCSTCIKNAWKNLPLWCKAVFIASVAIYFMSFLSEYVLYALFCSPPLIIYKFQGKFEYRCSKMSFL